MSAMQTRVVLRDRGGLETIDLSFALLRVHRRAFAILAAIVLPPATAIVALTPTARDANYGVVLVTLAVASIAQSAFTLLASKLVFQPDVRVRAVLREWLRQLPSLLGARALYAIAVGFLLCIFILPGVSVATDWCFAVEVQLLERAPIGRIFSRSKELSSSALNTARFVTWTSPIVGLLLGAAFASAMRETIGALLQAPGLVAFLDGTSHRLVLYGFVLAAPLVATTRLLVYLGARGQLEGWDVQAAAAGLATQHTELQKEAA
jgi:hypothetical protein